MPAGYVHFLLEYESTVDILTFCKIACLDKIWLLSCPKTSRPIRMQDSLNYNNSQTSWDMKLNFCMWLDVHRSNAIQSFQVGVVRHTWNPPPLYLGRWGAGGGGGFCQALRDLKFLPTLGRWGLSQKGGLQFFTLFEGDIRVFFTGGWGESLIVQNFTHPFPIKKIHNLRHRD